MKKENNKYGNGEIVYSKDQYKLKAEIRFQPLFNGSCFDNYVYGSKQEGVSAILREIAKKRGKDVCHCGRVIGTSDKVKSLQAEVSRLKQAIRKISRVV